jgi:hypothetical protein
MSFASNAGAVSPSINFAFASGENETKSIAVANIRIKTHMSDN